MIGSAKAAEYKQKRCINLAKRGIIALNVEWLGMGQLHAATDMPRADEINSICAAPAAWRRFICR